MLKVSTTRTNTDTISDSLILNIDDNVLKDVINCEKLSLSCQSENIILNVDKTKRKKIKCTSNIVTPVINNRSLQVRVI